MKYRTSFNEEIIVGEPRIIEDEIKREIIEQIQQLGAFDYENVCDNMRLVADIIEILEDYIGDDFIVLKHSAMGFWYKEDDKEEIEHYKAEVKI